MRTVAPYEVNPRQLRALVLLLALLPLVPTAFVIRFFYEEVRTERAEARVRAKEVYQKLLTDHRATLANDTWQQIPRLAGADAADPWKVFAAADAADAVLVIGPRGKLALPPAPAAPDSPILAARETAALQLSRGLLDTGLNRIPVTNAARMRWRFLSETPEPLFALVVPTVATAPAVPAFLLVTTRRHFLHEIGTFYRKRLDARTLVRVMDENGDAVNLPAPDVQTPPAGEKLAEMALPAPLPAWRVQIFSVDATLVEGIMHDQIVSYTRILGAMLTLTALIAAVAGWTLSRRIAFNELSNDALAAVAHEMKTPLSSTRMLLETLLQGRYQGGAAQVEEYLRLMVGENERLERLVNGFQMLGRLEHSHRRGSDLRLVPVPLAEVIEAARAQLAPRLEETQREVLVHIADPPPICLADREALTAALVNLLDNAVKYSEPGTPISVRATADEDGILLEVEDQGIGIPADEQDKIFERFYQSDQRLARTYGGCGLGLSIVQSVVRLHGGTVAVRSTPGRGSTFTVRLPRSGGTAPAVAVDSPRAFSWLLRRRPSHW